MKIGKGALLIYLRTIVDASASDVADALEISLPTVSMALLRLVRSGLANRTWDPKRGVFFYSITPRGEARVNYFAARGL
ncbi:MAG: winged helix DNA-binding protein [Betaproteobacteria bacterium]|nr:winged helix DNA-binding protein [Betaproteobacteria bacterium]